MKIKKEETNLIVLTERAFLTRLIGLVFFFIGLFVIVFPKYVASKVPIWLSLVFVVSGAAVILFAKNRTVTIDKIAAKISISDSSFVKKQKSECMLSDIKCVKLCVEVDKKIEAGKGIETNYWYWLELITKNGVAVELSSKVGNKSSISFSVPYKNLGEKIATFINVPFEENLPPTFGGVIAGIKNGFNGNRGNI